MRIQSSEFKEIESNFSRIALKECLIHNQTQIRLIWIFSFDTKYSYSVVYATSVVVRFVTSVIFYSLIGEKGLAFALIVRPLRLLMLWPEAQVLLMNGWDV